MQSAAESRVERLAGKYPVVTFYVLAFAISWVGFIPLFAQQLAPSVLASHLWFIGLVFPGVGPAVAALVATRMSCLRVEGDGTSLVRLKEAFLRPVPFRWWITTLLLSVGSMWLAAALGSFVRGGYSPILNPVSFSGLLIFTAMSLAANPFEEIGWRGFAQRRLQENRSVIKAALVVGVLWAFWHIPFFLLGSGPMSMSRVPFWTWATGVIPQAILMAWLYNSTDQSLAAVSACHVLGNVAGMMFNSSALMVSAVRLVAALIVVLIARPSLNKHYKRPTRYQISLGSTTDQNRGSRS